MKKKYIYWNGDGGFGPNLHKSAKAAYMEAKQDGYEGAEVYILVITGIVEVKVESSISFSPEKGLTSPIFT